VSKVKASERKSCANFKCFAIYIFGSGATFSGHNVGEVEWVGGGCGLAKRGELWGQAGVNWEVARVPKQLFPAGSILN